MGDLQETDPLDIPSVTEQTPWPVGFFDFGLWTNGGVRFFNPTCIAREDGDWLVARRSEPWEHADIGKNSLVACRMGKVGKRYELAESFPVVFPKRYTGEHFEDPRAMMLFGAPCISCTNFKIVPGQLWHGSHQIIGQVDAKWKLVKLADPSFAKNGGSIYGQRGNEKNWLWFEHGGMLHMVYTSAPHQVVRFDKFIKPMTTYATQMKECPWLMGTPRGGTPPVLVDGEYWSFFHSSVMWVGKKRRYYMGAYAFEAKPPFRITKMTPQWILAGSRKDPWAPGLPLVVFPGGAIYRDEKWLIVFGVNDYCSGWIEIPHQELVPHMEPVESEEIDSVVDARGNAMNKDGTYPPKLTEGEPEQEVFNESFDLPSQ